MYTRFRGQGSSRNPRSQGGSFGGGRGRHTIKTFDPTQLMQAVPVRTVVEEYVPTYTDFTGFGLSETLVTNIVAKGYTQPTPIQDQAIPKLMEGRDLIGIANTGTGKTAAFLLPLIEKVLKDRTQKVLIVSPTRELASQIKDELFSFSRNLGIYSVLCIGGMSEMRQRNDLRRPFSFVIGTPGRIKDLVTTRALVLDNFHSVVLDEADHMVDIGFIHDVKFIVSHLSTKRQSLFFSATIDAKVRDILHEFVQNPATVSVKTQDTAENVEQKTIKIDRRNNKIDQLQELLIQSEYDKVLIFGRTKWGVQKLSDELVKRGFKADAIHGNKNQNQRLRTLDKFKRNEIKILLATDVASRGLDIPNVSHVINYDLPESLDAYVHRIGRTGRADKKGVALTFVD